VSRLNFACGSSRWEGFDNSDINRAPGTSYVDLTDFPYPYDDESAELIMISHSIQITVEGKRVIDVPRFLRECHRILEPRGWLRVNDNPLRLYRDSDVIDPWERSEESHRGFPPELRISRDEFSGMLISAGFALVREGPPSQTVIPCEGAVRAAVLGNHLFHPSIAIEAQK